MNWFWGGWGSGVLAFWRSGVLAFWRSGVLAFWRSGVLAFWRSGVLAFWRSGRSLIFQLQDVESFCYFLGPGSLSSHKKSPPFGGLSQ
ncbi:hypothetical protein [Photobacterium lipolyticum]|uniref:Uncharacterized protein n=1 Tax=Photobacterium lipolyticum TaxID=266810 RepID=A0A2T3MS17_9GAMM|nr:hypothetical protein [Photobacterium lipolyticum]PSV99986.1 hypothetical protein C9I89_21565 [Photobacterium lipolyticum]